MWKLLGAFVVILGLSLTVEGGGGCVNQFKNFKDFEKVMDTCKTKLNLKPADMLKNPLEELPKLGYEDKCYIKCVLTEMKYMKDDGSTDMKSVEDDLKKNAPDGKADALLALIKTCAETTTKDAVISKDPCKSAAMTKVCYMKGQEAICP